MLKILPFFGLALISAAIVAVAVFTLNYFDIESIDQQTGFIGWAAVTAFIGVLYQAYKNQKTTQEKREREINDRAESVYWALKDFIVMFPKERSIDTNEKNLAKLAGTWVAVGDKISEYLIHWKDNPEHLAGIDSRIRLKLRVINILSRRLKEITEAISRRYFSIVEQENLTDERRLIVQEQIASIVRDAQEIHSMICRSAADARRMLERRYAIPPDKDFENQVLTPGEKDMANGYYFIARRPDSVTSGGYNQNIHNDLAQSFIKYTAQAYGIAFVAIFGGLFSLKTNSHWIPPLQNMLFMLAVGLIAFAIALAIIHYVGLKYFALDREHLKGQTKKADDIVDAEEGISSRVDKQPRSKQLERLDVIATVFVGVSVVMLISALLIFTYNMNPNPYAWCVWPTEILGGV